MDAREIIETIKELVEREMAAGRLDGVTDTPWGHGDADIFLDTADGDRIIAAAAVVTW